MTIEYRYLRGDQPDAEEGKLHGRAAPFNSWTTIGGDKWGFRERIAPGAFAKSIKERDIVLLDNHDSAKPLARTSAGTLDLVEKKDSGLHFDATPAKTTYGQDALENVRAKNYGGMSFGFEVIRDGWKRGENGAPDERTLHEVRLHEISVVTFPAYTDTDVKARDSLAAAKESRDRALGTDAPDITVTGNDYTDMAAELISAYNALPADQREAIPAELRELFERADNKPYGNVTYADPKNGKYPVDTLKHAKAAWSYINMPKNAAKYPLNGVSLASVKAKIKAALKKFGVKVSEKNDELLLEAAELRALVEDALTPSGDHGAIYTEKVMEALRATEEYLSRDETANDPYSDEFYERDEDGDTDGDNDSDAAGSDGGSKPCADCDDTGKDKSGNKCATCGGSKGKHGDGKKHESGSGDEKTNTKGETKNEDSDADTRDGENGEPDDSTRADDDDDIALRFSMIKLRSRDDIRP